MRMSTLLFAVGGPVLAAGLIIIGFGMPASALDFGNTLIVAGTTTAIGGLIVIALGAVVAQLQRLGEALSPLGPDLASKEERLHPIAPERVTVPPQPFEPRGPVPPPEFPMPQSSFAPRLPNPEEVSAEPRAEAPRPVAPPKDVEVVSAPPPSEPRPASAPTPQPVMVENEEDAPTSPFDFMWPAPTREAGRSVEPPPRSEPPSAVPGFDSPPEREKRRTVAILKSGVVDGMSYTLYVDGSIEAELPQGTLRFANIQELRAHLEKNG